MASLTGKQIDNTYHGLIKTNDELAIGVQAKRLQDGDGNDLPVAVGTQSMEYFDTQDFTGATVLGIAAGAQGAQGPQGWQGIAGTDGLQGPQGWQGFQGNDGPQGLTGAGVQGPQGWQGIAGTDGLQGFQGWQGPSEAGVQGPQGLQGPSSGGGGSGTLQGVLSTGTQGSIVYDSTHGDGNWKTWLLTSGFSVTSQAFTTDTAGYVTFTLPTGDIISYVRLSVSSAGGAGSTLRVLLYDTTVNGNNDILLKDQLQDLGTIDASSTGVKTITLGTPYTVTGSEPNSIIAVVLWPSEAMSIHGFNSPIWDGNGGIMFGDTTIYRSFNRRVEAGTWGTTIPTDLSSSKHVSTTNNPWWVLIR